MRRNRLDEMIKVMKRRFQVRDYSDYSGVLTRTGSSRAMYPPQKVAKKTA